MWSEEHRAAASSLGRAAVRLPRGAGTAAPELGSSLCLRPRLGACRAGDKEIWLWAECLQPQEQLAVRVMPWILIVCHSLALLLGRCLRNVSLCSASSSRADLLCAWAVYLPATTG